ncbi:DUF559 domain-containing protein [Sphingomonas ginsenosidivorax]
MYPVRRQISRHATRQRREYTDVEQIICLAVRNRRLRFQVSRAAYDWRPLGSDLPCLEARLVVELDGGHHDPTIDAPRTAALEGK